MARPLERELEAPLHLIDYDTAPIKSTLQHEDDTGASHGRLVLRSLSLRAAARAPPTSGAAAPIPSQTHTPSKLQHIRPHSHAPEAKRLRHRLLEDSTVGSTMAASYAARPVSATEPTSSGGRPADAVQLSSNMVVSSSTARAPPRRDQVQMPHSQSQVPTQQHRPPAMTAREARARRRRALRLRAMNVD